MAPPLLLVAALYAGEFVVLGLRGSVGAWDTGGAGGWLVGDFRLAIRSFTLTAPFAAALFDGEGLRDCLRKRRLRPGAVGGRMAFMGCGAGTGRTGRQAPFPFSRSWRPGDGGMRWRLPDAGSWSSALTGVVRISLACAVNAMGRVEPAAAAKRAWTRAGMAA